MVIVQLTSSRFFGSVERQMLGLAQALPGDYQTVFLSFSERGLSKAFLAKAESEGFQASVLEHDTPHLLAAVRDLEGHLRRHKANFLCCHGYKAILLGLWAARRVGIPALAVSHGWTGEDFKVRLYERVEKFGLRRMDAVVCVSQGQADKVLRAGVSAERVFVIHDAVRADRFDRDDSSYRAKLEGFFGEPPRHFVAAAGRLSPEKGFEVLIDAAAEVVQSNPSIGFVLFGDGPLRDALARQISRLKLGDKFILAGFRTDLDGFLPHFDLMVLPSYTEGLPNVVLEAFAAGVPVVATAVGGTPEIVDDGASGYLVPAGDATALGRRIRDALACEEARRAMVSRGRQRVLDDFTFAAQSQEYQRLLARFPSPADRVLSQGGTR